jgi:hypothetical protein
VCVCVWPGQNEKVRLFLDHCLFVVLFEEV